MSVLANMGTDTKIAGTVFAVSTVAYFISRHFDKKATAQALEESPPQAQQVQSQAQQSGVEPVNP